MARIYFVGRRFYYETGERAVFVGTKAVRGTTAAGGGTEINATLGTLTLTSFNATVSSAKNIDATTDTLTLASFNATVNAETGINATLGTLTLASFNATVNAETGISAAADTLTLTSFNATVEAGTEVNAGVGSLSFTSYNAVVESGVPTGDTVLFTGDYLPKQPKSFKPHGPLEIAPSSLTNGLVLLDAMSGAFRGDLIRRDVRTDSGVEYLANNRHGQTLSFGVFDRSTYPLTPDSAEETYLVVAKNRDGARPELLSTIDMAALSEGVRVYDNTATVTRFLFDYGAGSIGLDVTIGDRSQWHAAVAGYDSAETLGAGYNFETGKLTEASGTGPFAITHNNNVHLGEDKDGFFSGYDGEIAFVAIWDRKLSPAEMRQVVQDPYVLVRKVNTSRVIGQKENTDITATLDTLTLTSFNASINAATNVNATAGTKTLNSFNATVKADNDVSAAADTLTLTGYNVTVSTGQAVNATTDTLTLTSYGVTVGKTQEVQATTGSMTLATFGVTVGKSINVQAGVATATLTPLTATIVKGVSLTTTLETLTATAYNVHVTDGEAGSTGFYRNVPGNDPDAPGPGTSFYDDVSGNDPDASTPGGGFFS